MKKVYSYKKIYSNCTDEEYQNIFKDKELAFLAVKHMFTGVITTYDIVNDIELHNDFELIAVRGVSETYMWEDFDRVHKIQPHLGTIAAVKISNKMHKIEVVGFSDISHQVYCRHESGFTDTYILSDLYPYESPDEIKKRVEDEFIDKTLRDMGIDCTSISYQIVKSAIRRTYRELKGIDND